MDANRMLIEAQMHLECMNEVFLEMEDLGNRLRLLVLRLRVGAVGKRRRTAQEQRHGKDKRDATMGFHDGFRERGCIGMTAQRDRQVQ